MEQPDLPREQAEQAINSKFSGCCDIESGSSGGFRRRIPDGVDPQASQGVKLLTAISRSVGAGQKDRIELPLFEGCPFDRFNLEQGSCDRI
jgi:hypothetical protein